MSPPIIIQGGMGVGVSNWNLARAVSQQGQLGVVSGTLLPVVLARRLQQGDPGGHMRRALAHFPLPAVAERILASYFVAGGLLAETSFKLTPMPALPGGTALVELTVAANFVEIFLAKENHAGLVGINLLEKIQIPTLPSIYGAMLAGVDYVLMGAGIPRAIPGALDQLARGETAQLKIDVTANPAAAADGQAPATEALATFDPAQFFKGPVPVLRRPQFIAIVSSATLALTLARKSTGRVDGFVVETEAAGGHNAPPRGAMQLTPAGEPLYGERDRPDFEKIRAIGLPFWIAGAHAEPARLAEARRLGAAGVQIGTAFAFCEESGIDAALKRDVCALARAGLTKIFTDPLASPTGFPFKVLDHPNSLSSAANYAERPRLCDLGYLREAFAKPDGTLGYRCAGEPVDDYVRKGGAEADTVGRKCLCNGLLATVGLGQRSATHAERPLITAGHDVAQLARFFRNGESSYRAADVLDATLAIA
ncbi:MAG: nitronate monooxygenase [Opitutaceae bacterium]|nr:nitronate monooxygenase [Opitutaceae bacterium]